MFKDLNIALLAKLGRTIASGEKSLWTEVLKAKYLKGDSFFHCKPASGNSMVWKGILCSRNALLKGACYKIGNGFSINPWEDPWIPWIDGFTPKPKKGIDVKSWSRVADLRLEVTEDGTKLC